MAGPSSTSSGTTSGQQTREELKQDARDLKDTAASQGEAKAAQQKDQVGRTAHSASSAMNTAADELRKDDQAPDWLASAFSSVAREVDSLASRLENKSPRELAGETRRFARNNPSAFLAASAAAGFAAARFLPAGAEYSDDFDVDGNQSGGSNFGGSSYGGGTTGGSTYGGSTTGGSTYGGSSIDRTGTSSGSSGSFDTSSTNTPDYTAGVGERDQTVAQARANTATTRPTGGTQ